MCCRVAQDGAGHHKSLTVRSRGSHRTSGGCRSGAGSSRLRQSMPKRLAARCSANGSKPRPSAERLDFRAAPTSVRRDQRCLRRPPQGRRRYRPQSARGGSCIKPVCPDPGSPGPSVGCGSGTGPGTGPPRQRSATAGGGACLRGCAGPAQRRHPVDMDLAVSQLQGGPLWPQTVALSDGARKSEIRGLFKGTKTPLFAQG